MVANCWSPGDGFYWWGIENGIRRKWHHARSYLDNFNWCSMQIEYMFRLTLSLPVFAMSSVSLPLTFQWKILSKAGRGWVRTRRLLSPTGFWWRVDKTWRQCGFAFDSEIVVRSSADSLEWKCCDILDPIVNSALQYCCYFSVENKDFHCNSSEDLFHLQIVVAPLSGRLMNTLYGILIVCVLL